ncbi:hypothetical protein DVH24_005110 [Malus domestica]|uniref:Uncharacterized protein n=1 Tax=Malus domestica TaxID=3750 RepID=A0A498ICK7_MALDO|nr:hypothetical protein DVH24_005110 [Malus domestica]
MNTNLGFRSPFETALPGSQWGSLFTALQVLAIDELYYGDAITHFVEELNALEVVVDDSRASNMIVVQFNALVSSSNLAPSTAMSLLGCIKELTPRESILFSSKWGSISFFVDLPLIDDAYYGIDIYKFRDELQILGVIMDFEQGASFKLRRVESASVELEVNEERIEGEGNEEMRKGGRKGEGRRYQHKEKMEGFYFGKFSYVFK